MERVLCPGGGGGGGGGGGDEGFVNVCLISDREPIFSPSQFTVMINLDATQITQHI